jgi:cation:H+ antiporter
LVSPRDDVTADIVELVVSLAMLTVAGDQFVIGLARSAAALRVRPTVVGALVGGFGTSLPELLVAAVATAQHKPQIAVGNLVGSNIANVSLGLGIAALVAPVRVESRTLRREAPLCVAAVLLLAVTAGSGFEPVEGVVLLIALVAAVVALLVNARRGTVRDELALEVAEFFDLPAHRLPSVEAIRTILGMALMVGAAELLVHSAGALADRLGLSEGFVGLTVVAIGTSAPLIASAIQAVRRGDHDLVVGNVLGSNLFISLAGGAIVGLLPGGAAPGVGVAPLAVMAAVVVAAWAFMARGSRITRPEALVLIAAYAATMPFVAR